MRYVITGGAGFVGRHLADYLLKNNHDVVVIDNLYNSRIENISNIIDQIDFHKIDILEKEKLKPIIKNSDGIFHQAALVDVQDSYKQTKKFFDVNVLGTKNIFELSQEFGIKTVFASSSGVYGDAKDVPTLEISERMPLSPYAETKLEDEYLAEKFSKSDVSIIGLRYFNIYGKGQSDAYAGVITKFLKNALEKKQLQINGDGSKGFAHESTKAKRGYDQWCRAELHEVVDNINPFIPQEQVHYIVGDVCETLKNPENIPGQIAFLRLDTDWYESTIAELIALYPKVAPGGIIVIDDYNSWQGSKKAFHEAFGDSIKIHTIDQVAIWFRKE